MSQTHSDNLPTVINSEIIMHDFVKVRKDTLERKDGKHYRYYTVVVPGAAALVLAKTPEGLYVITKEYRHPVGQTILSIAGGYIDEGEDPIEAARRELLEETGYAAENFVLLGGSYPYAGLSSQMIYYVYADNARKVQDSNLEVSEHIEVAPMAYEDFQQRALAGEPVDGNLLTAFSWLSMRELA